MIFMMRILTLSALATLLPACAAPPAPPLTASHPASPEAPEGARVPRESSLRPDEATRKSRALLSAARKEQEHWDAVGPVSGTPEETPKGEPKMEMKHEHP